LLRKILYVLALLFIIVVLGYRLIDEPVPKGKKGPRAEYLAEKMLDALGYDNWKNINAIQWSYPRGHDYIWDKQSKLVQVKWDDYRVILNTETRKGEVYLNEELKADDDKALEKAYSYFANDSFWLIAPFKIKDPGTIRKVVDHESGDALLVEYTSGGVTPGDKYLWILNENGVPVAWKFWVSLIPIGGIEYSWEGWQSFNGASISTFHEGLLDIEITNLNTASAVESLNNGVDPFQTIR